MKLVRMLGFELIRPDDVKPVQLFVKGPCDVVM